jgi:integrase/recombinase XerD
MTDSESIVLTVGRFLEHRRAHGRKYLSEESELRLLLRFCAEHDVRRVGELTAASLDDFLASRPRSRPRSFNHLLGVVGCLLDWAVSQQLIEVSPLRARRRRVTSSRIPFLFDPYQARRVLDAAGALADNARAPQRGPTYRTLFALCYGLGLRAGETCGLRLRDVDTARDLLVVRGGKFGKSRLVPHGPRIAALLGKQLERRRRCGSIGGEEPLFTFNGRTSINPCTASQTFHQLVGALDLLVPAGVSPPRLHSLRHSFAVGCLLRWYREGLDPAARLPQLSTFMGHVDPSSTAVYLTITPAPRRSQSPLRAVRRVGVDGDGGMTPQAPLGQLLHSFFVDHLITVKGLRPASVRSYRDTIRLLLLFVAADKRSKLTRLTVGDLTFDRIVAFLRHLEQDRGNHIRTRNQRLAALHTLFEYIATRSPEVLMVCQQVAAIPTKRVPPPETRFLERDEIHQLLHDLPSHSRLGLRDHALILFLYNTGARVQEVADLRVEHLDLSEHPTVRLHGKGDKWRTCPLWQQTAQTLNELLGSLDPPAAPHSAVFTARGQPLTRSGIYKIVRRHASDLDNLRTGRRISPHIFRHTAAVHLLEAGVEVNVIRGWLGNADLTTTNRYAEINTKAKQAALLRTEPPGISAGSRTNPIWRTNETLLNWLASL